MIRNFVPIGKRRQARWTQFREIMQSLYGTNENIWRLRLSSNYAYAHLQYDHTIVSFSSVNQLFNTLLQPVGYRQRVVEVEGTTHHYIAFASGLTDTNQIPTRIPTRR